MEPHIEATAKLLAKYARESAALESENKELRKVLKEFRENENVVIVKLNAFASDCDIDSKNLVYTEPWGTHEGMQCNYAGDHENYGKIFDLCRTISKAAKELNTLNQMDGKQHVNL